MADEGCSNWQQTVAILQNDADPIVDKPKLQEKYLCKPPFRFLHDVISAVQANTGFAPGLYSGNECDAKAIQDKDGKIAYLSKIINVVGLVLNEHVPAKPLKIIAGLDADNTNTFLQMLGKACRMGSAADAVQRVLGGEQQPEPGASGREGRPSSRPSSQQRPEPPPREEPPPAPAADPPKKSVVRRSDSGKPDPPAAAAAAAAKKGAKPSPSKPSSKAAPPPPAPEEPPPQQLRTSINGAPATLQRPQSARKAPPKLAAAGGAGPTPSSQPILGRSDTLQRGEPGMGGGGGPQRPGSAARRATNQQGGGDLRGMGGSARTVALLEEGAGRKGRAGGNDSDDDVEVVHEAAPVALGPRVEGEQGVLVKNILEEEERLRKAGAEAAADGEDGSTGIILGRRKAAATTGPSVKANDLGSIRDMVQRLCQSSLPLAKSMDYMAEDLENMQKEYRFWSTEKRMFQERLADEQRLAGDTNSSALVLSDLDGQIKQARDRILGLKGQVLRNDESINRMLRLAVG